MAVFQHTLRDEVEFSGIGLHTGEKVSLRLRPAAADVGLMIRRSDLDSKYIPCIYKNVLSTSHATTIGNGDWSISTVEHLLAALSGLGVDNAYIDVEGPEVPAMDGSAAPFVYGILSAGVKLQRAPRRYIDVKEELVVRVGESMVSLEPATHFAISVEIDFPHPAIEKQRYTTKVNSKVFRSEIAKARTFGFLKEVDWLRSQGLALGGSLDNAVVVGDHGVLNGDGLRFDDEFVRHKALDLIGDLALLGAPLKAKITAVKSGHALHHRLAKALMEGEYSWDYVTSPSIELPTISAPGADVTVQVQMATA